MLKNLRRGQVATLFALLLPIFLLFVGLTLDLGWYYLNVSRLQNAADAAAVAGAQTLIADVKALKNYKGVTLVNNYKEFKGSSYKYLADEKSTQEKIDTVNAKSLEEYVNKNLSSESSGSYVDHWTKTKIDASSALYEVNDNLYYVVHLSETIRHFFLPGWFDDMLAPVTAVAMISKQPIEQVYDAPEMLPEINIPVIPEIREDELELTDEENNQFKATLNTNTIADNWEVQKQYKDDYKDTSKHEDDNGNPITEFEARFKYKVYRGNWNIFQDTKFHYYRGDLYRRETINILDDVIKTNTGNSKYGDKWGYKGSSVRQTNASIDKISNPNGNPYLQEYLDSMDVDFHPELYLSNNRWLNENWDLTMGLTDVGSETDYSDYDTSDGYDKTDIRQLRIHSSLNFERPPYEVREGVKDDVMWVRIESEPMVRYPDIVRTNQDTVSLINGGKGITALNSVHQIILNANSSNYDSGDTKYRPYVIYYNGPERYNSETSDPSVRDSKPVILNLNAPFRAILYMPNSPVVIMGSAQNEFRGLIVAKEYVQLKTRDDFDMKNPKERYYKKSDRVHELTLSADGKFYDVNKKVVTDNIYVETVYKSKDDGKYYFYVPADENENGIEMFVDVYGDIQYKELDETPHKIGTYDNFGRTDLYDYSGMMTTDTEHNFLSSILVDNLLYSGVK